MAQAKEQLELDLMPDHSVRITVRLRSAYEAAIFYEDMAEAARSGSLILDFGTENPRVVLDRTTE